MTFLLSRIIFKPHWVSVSPLIPMARICKILGAGFAPYLPMVMAPVMKTASMKPEVALLDNDEVEGVGDDLL